MYIVFVWFHREMRREFFKQLFKQSRNQIKLYVQQLMQVELLKEFLFLISFIHFSSFFFRCPIIECLKTLIFYFFLVLNNIESKFFFNIFSKFFFCPINLIDFALAILQHLFFLKRFCQIS